MSYLHQKVQLEMNYSWEKKFLDNLNEELKASGENKPAPQNMPHYLIFNIAERHIGEFCTITNSFLD